ncbi:MAG: SGNH/GDSL hydrolase family protein, partial [Planctomycetaceae bacterium]|nr:SGNH/GDSL hydrolase family protein [Planctomycetaceae bacterium]
MTNSRREFLSTGLGLSAASLAALTVSPSTSSAAEHGEPLIGKGDTILFQGDSITDAGRSRDHAGEVNHQQALGNGYAWMAAADLLVTQPDANLKCWNRGISGNKVFQLADRWQADCLDLKPNVLSILIGVNDIWHALNGRYDGTVETYETDYRKLLTRTKDALPDVKLVICEPFVLRCGAVTDEWFPQFDAFRASAKKLADEFHAVFVPFQSMFDRAVEYAPPEHWAKDGVHPSPYGAALMAHQW